MAGEGRASVVARRNHPHHHRLLTPAVVNTHVQHLRNHAVGKEQLDKITASDMRRSRSQSGGETAETGMESGVLEVREMAGVDERRAGVVG